MENVVQVTPPQLNLGKTEVPTQPMAEKRQVLRRFPRANPKNLLITVFLSVVVVLAGVATGYIISGAGAKTKSPISQIAKLGSSQKSLKEAGVADEGVFKDSAQGILKEGGIEGEGTHHLERDGGPTKYVYLTSTVIDLQSFVDKKVEVFGETLAGKKAGWLMDVGKIKALE